MTRKRLMHYIKQVIDTEIADSWKGGGDPRDEPEIEERLKKAHIALQKALDRHDEDLRNSGRHATKS